MNAILAATQASLELRTFFSVLLVLLLAVAAYMLRNYRRFFSHTGDPGDTYALANLRLWMVILILVHAIVITAIMIFEV